MRKLLCIVVLVTFFNNILIGNTQSVQNLDLFDFKDYVVSIIQKTMHRVENNHWCNLKIDNVYMNISENVLGTNMLGTVEFTDGFLLSLEKIDIIENTVQRAWYPQRVNSTRVEVRATMRMTNFVIGFDVLAKMEDNELRSRGSLRYSDLRFPFVISKDLYTDVITVTVTSQLMTNLRTNIMEFTPENEVTKVLSYLFSSNSAASSFQRWATETFAPVAQDVAENELEFPRINYNTILIR